MGLFGRKSRKAPSGWVTVDALIDSVDKGRFDKYEDAMGNTNKRSPRREKYLFDYVFPGPGGGMLRLEGKERRQQKEALLQGERVTLAYDPNNPEDFKLLENEHERRIRIAKDAKRYMEQGIEAPVVVTKVEETGRIARPPLPGETSTPDPSKEATEKYLTLKVSPADGEEFEVVKKHWDRQMDIQPGTAGLLFYDSSDPENESYPLFADATMRAAGPMALELAKVDLQTKLMQV